MTISFQGSLYGKALYTVNNKTREKLVGPVWTCNYGNSVALKQFEKVAKKNPQSVSLTQRVINAQPNLVFEMDKKLFKKSISFLTKIGISQNTEEEQAKLLKLKDVKTFVFNLPKKEYHSFKSAGAHYEFIDDVKYTNPFRIVQKFFHDIKIKKIEKFLENTVKTDSEKKFLDDYLKNW